MLKAILVFYQKLIIPTAVLSILFGIIGGFSLKSVGIAYLFLAPLFHFFIYEVRNRNEYYFYYNLGLSKLTLWGISLGLNLLIALILVSL